MLSMHKKLIPDFYVYNKLLMHPEFKVKENISSHLNFVLPVTNPVLLKQILT